MDSISFKLAILNALAKYPGARATLDDFRREVEIIIASADHIEPLNDLSALADVDIFRSGLVLQDDAGVQVSTAGLAPCDAAQPAMSSACAWWEIMPSMNWMSAAV